MHEEGIMQELTHLIEIYGLLLIFAAVLLDEIGLPIPSLPALVVAGALAGNGHFSLPAVIGAGLAGALVADAIWYWACRYFGRRVLSTLCRISLAPDSCVRQTENLYHRVGPWSLIFSRYVPAFSSIAVAMAAIMRLSLPLFLALNLVGSFLYYGLVALLGAIFHRAVADVLHTMETFGTISVVALVAAFAAYVLFRWWERVTFIRQLRMDRITVDELVGLIESGNPPIILDVRSADARDRDGIIPGALGAHPEDIHPLLKQISPDTEIVVYCACPNEASAAVAARHLKRAGFKKIRPLLGGVEAWVDAGRDLANI
jgi:membrane protein DedA with SNARE-associated domain/rhodanese-related sulfurtransferase